MQRWIRALFLLLFLAPANGAGAADAVAPALLSTVYPGAERLGTFSGTPPAAPVFIGGTVAGYLLSTEQVVGSTGYGGKPVDVLVGVTAKGVITGAYLRRHSEPILVIGISDADLKAYVGGFKGLDVLAPAARRLKRGEPGLPDAISGATISSAVIRDAVIRATRAVLRSRTNGGGTAAGGRHLDRATFTPATWAELVADGSIAHRRILQREASALVGGTDNPDDLFVDLYATLMTPAAIGGNLIGRRQHQQMFSSLGARDNAVLIAANGAYSIKGRAYRRTGVFDRIQIVQGNRTIRLLRSAYTNYQTLKGDAPELREVALFTLPQDIGFDPLEPWRVELFVRRETAAGGMRQGTLFLDYKVPARYITAAPATGETAAMADADRDPLWLGIWRDRKGRVAGVVLILAVLTVMLVFQDQLAARSRLRHWARLGFLGVVLVWLGWYAGGQLSVLQALTFAHAFLTGFKWEHFLVDPVIFILWSYVAMALLFWGRGVYCGWLCPFGALQELTNAAARHFRLPQVNIPFRLHERLWTIKYIVFLGLFAASLQSIRHTMLYAEVEPFKTAISLMFVRHWPFVLYAAGLLAIGLFVERFFCRYVCPLGAALAIPARLRMFNWLKRRHQCGTECAICAERCTVQAIHPTGEINPNECIHCLECQTYYFDDHVCPPLAARRKRRERRLALSQAKADRPEAAAGGEARP